MKFIFIALLLISALHAQQTIMPHSEEALPPPWFTGTLLAPAGEVYQVGSFAIQPYIYCTNINGVYDKEWDRQKKPTFFNLNTQLFLTFGLTKFMDIFILPQFSYNATQGRSNTNFMDLQVALDFQIITTTAFTYFPGVKLTVREIFPTGKYQNLNPDKLGTDITGAGTYSTFVDVIFYKVVKFKDPHYLSLLLDLSSAFSTPVSVKGFNAYGGGYGTDGIVKPGYAFTAIFSFEFSFTKHWAFAMDTVYSHNNRDRFTGTSGFVLPGVITGVVNPALGFTTVNLEADVGDPSSEQFSLAPAIEYDFNYHLGLLVGAWFTIAGRNAQAFQSGVISLEYTY